MSNDWLSLPGGEAEGGQNSMIDYNDYTFNRHSQALDICRCCDGPIYQNEPHHTVSRQLDDGSVDQMRFCRTCVEAHKHRVRVEEAYRWDQGESHGHGQAAWS